MANNLILRPDAVSIVRYDLSINRHPATVNRRAAIIPGAFRLTGFQDFGERWLTHDVGRPYGD
jgi:hypothetical protein